MARLAAVALVAAAVTSLGCQDSPAPRHTPGPPQLAASGSPCALDWARGEPSNVVLVEEEAPTCSVHFDTLVVLEGSAEGIAPRAPVIALTDGRYLTGTYQPGKVALWGADGMLLDLLGRGSGQGPGEFTAARSFAVDDRDGTLYVTTGRRRVHLYTLEGGFKDTWNLSGGGGSGEAVVAPGGELVTTVRDGPGDITVMMGGEFRHVGLKPDAAASPSQLATGHGLVWVARTPQYQITGWTISEDSATHVLRRMPEWDQAPLASAERQVFDLDVSRDGLFWVLFSRPDPEAPAGRQPSFETHEEAIRVLSAYRDNVLEVVSPDGRLLARRVFDDVSQNPTSIGHGKWVLDRSETELRLIITRASLAPL